MQELISEIFSEKKATHVLQLIVTFVPLSLLINSSLVPRSCLMMTRYFVGACLGRESRIEICVTSTNLQLARKDLWAEQEQSTNLTERRRRWRLS